MPARLFDINLQAVEFPFLSSDINRTAILADIPEPLPYTTNLVRPQAVYLRNVLPSKYGYDSVDVTNTFTDMVAGQNFKTVIPFLDADDQLHLLGITQNAIWFADDGTPTWVRQQTNIGIWTANTIWTYTRVNGVPFFCASGDAIYYYDISSGQLIATTVTALTMTNIHGIVGAVGYIIAWDTNNVYYTTSVDTGTWTIDFTPVLGTAGAYEMQDLQGAITTCQPIQNGFIAYSLKNAVSNLYSGNPSFPFNATGILGSSGVLSANQIASDGNLGYHYAWTENGLQQVTTSGATNVFSELFDFINNRTIETFDQTTGIFTPSTYTDYFEVRITFIGKRYLFISYGPLDNSVGYAHYLETVIYDADLKRWGKIVVDHTCICQYSFASDSVFETYNDLDTTTYNSLSSVEYINLTTGYHKQLGYALGFLLSSGRINAYSRSNMKDGTSNAISVICLGRIKFYKAGTQEVQEIYLEQFTGNVFMASSALDDMSEITFNEQGQNITTGTKSAFARRYGFNSSGMWSAIALSGKFHLTSISAFVNRAGRY